MTAAILTSSAILAVVALYWIHTWREVRLAQTKAHRDIANMLHGGSSSQDQRVLDALERATAHNEFFRRSFGPKPRLEVDNDPTGGDAA